MHLATLSDRAGDDRRGSRSKGVAEEEVDPRAAVVVRPFGVDDARDGKVSGIVSNERVALGGASGEAVAYEVPDDATDARVETVLEQDVAHVLRADGASCQDSKACDTNKGRIQENAHALGVQVLRVAWRRAGRR